MREPYVIFKGVSSADLGVIIEQLPDIHRAQRDIQELTIPGRDGMLVRDLGSWTLNTATLRVNCNGVPLHAVYAWLMGEGWLTTSDEPDFRIYTYVWNGITDKRFRVDGKCYDSLSINLRMSPFRYQAIEDALDYDIANAPPPRVSMTMDLWQTTRWTTASEAYELAFPGAGSYWSRPVITITPARNTKQVLGINGWTFVVDLSTDLPIVLDCEEMRAYRINQDESLTNVSRYVAIDTDEADEWPRLYPDGQANLLHWPYRSAALGGDISRIEIAPKWRWL